MLQKLNLDLCRQEHSSCVTRAGDVADHLESPVFLSPCRHGTKHTVFFPFNHLPNLCELADCSEHQVSHVQACTESPICKQTLKSTFIHVAQTPLVLDRAQTALHGKHWWSTHCFPYSICWVSRVCPVASATTKHMFIINQHGVM